MIELCKAKYSVRMAKYEADLVRELKEYYADVDMAGLATNLDFISHVCNCVEEKFKKDKKRYKVSKRDVAVSIIKKVIGEGKVSDAEVTTIKAAIESLHSSGHIDGLTKKKVACRLVKQLLKKIFS